jgi:hypothetical protein
VLSLVERSLGAVLLFVSGFSAVSACTAAPPAEPSSPACPLSSELVKPGRLSVREYLNTLRDVLGVDASDLVPFLAKDAITATFSNSAPDLGLGPEQLRGFHLVAQKVAARFFGGDPPPSKLPCIVASKDDVECREQIVETLALRLFRRPPTKAERARLLTLANDETTDVSGVELALQAMLIAPQFLLQFERAHPDAGHTDAECAEVERLDGFAIATRLALGLTETTPDDELLAAAEAGELDSAEGVASWAKELSSRTLAREARKSFAGQWLGVDELADVELDPEVHAGFTSELREAAGHELLRLSQDYIHGDARVLDLLTADHAWASPLLGEVYGVEISGSFPERIDFPDRGDRGGLFTTSAFAMLTAKFDSVSPVRRGKYIREVILCDAPPPPPPGVPMPAADAKDNPSNVLEQHLDDPSCSSCHEYLDPIGLGLERYDGVGRLRSEYPNGDPVPERGTVVGMDSGEFEGGRELGALLATSEQAARCFTLKASSWVLRRSLEDDDPTLDRLLPVFEDSGTLDDLVNALVVSDAFLYRRREPAE